MEYQRPSGLRVSPYTVGEKIVGLQRQLFLLREALVRTTIDFSYYPDLFRALRVLIIDKSAGRLGELAQLAGEDYSVQSRQLWVITDYPATTGDARPDAIAFFRNGLRGLFLPNHHSRWLTMRGVQSPSNTPPVPIDFWDYLASDVIAFKPEFGAKVTRRMLIAEVCNTRDVAHAAAEHPVFLQLAHALASTAPYFIEISQDVAYETLAFGRQVINKCTEIYGEEIAEALQNEIPVPIPVCAICRNPLAIEELICPRCTSSQLPPPRRFGPQEQISSVFHYGRFVEMDTGTVAVCLETSALTYASIAQYSLVDITSGDNRMRLARTSDMRLVWQVTRNLAAHTATWDLRETPESEQVCFFLTWSPERVSIATVSNRGGLWEAASDGVVRQVGDK